LQQIFDGSIGQKRTQDFGNAVSCSPPSSCVVVFFLQMPETAELETASLPWPRRDQE
jgi:hypothetical protein